MRLCTVLAGLVALGVMVSSALADDCKKGQGKHDGKHGHHFLTFKEIAGSDDAKATEDLYVQARLKNVPADKKEKATAHAKETWKRLAGDKKELAKTEYDDAVKKLIESYKAKQGKKKGCPKES